MSISSSAQLDAAHALAAALDAVDFGPAGQTAAPIIHAGAMQSRYLPNMQPGDVYIDIAPAGRESSRQTRSAIDAQMTLQVVIQAACTPQDDTVAARLIAIGEIAELHLYNTPTPAHQRWSAGHTPTSIVADAILSPDEIAANATAAVVLAVEYTVRQELAP